mmetsp:Transcript_10676/g.30640  ORF Transcript_10676/g.30640 Transcript_10676/m.30640 type:complete len:96 (-) Transcript_10676:227-514(-)
MRTMRTCSRGVEQLSGGVEQLPEQPPASSKTVAAPSHPSQVTKDNLRQLLSFSMAMGRHHDGPSRPHKERPRIGRQGIGLSHGESAADSRPYLSN